MTQIQARGNAVEIIGAETGHTVQPVAFCDTPERAAEITKALRAYQTLKIVETVETESEEIDGFCYTRGHYTKPSGYKTVSLLGVPADEAEELAKLVREAK